jgi:hypothetical protein
MKKILFSGTYMFIMKKIVLVSFILVLCTASFAQLRYFFPDSNACFSAGSYKFWFNGDTAINNLKYKKVYMQSYDSIPDFGRASYYSAIREDTLAEKVYMFALGDTMERLIYDFTLREGDSVRVSNFCPQLCYTPEWENMCPVPVVEKVDSILIGDNYRKRIVITKEDQYSDQWFELCWIEGIGSSNGPFTPLESCIVDGGFVGPLLCVHIDGELVYQPYAEIEGLDGCYSYNGLGEINDSYLESINIYPTVADDVLNIEHSDIFDAGCKYFIYNILGKQVADGKLDSNMINVSYLESGMYMIVLYKSDKVYSGRFVKK